MTAVLLPLRWQRHHVDVCAILDDREVKWIARDIAVALEGDPGDFADEPGHTPLVVADHIHASAYPLDTARQAIGDTTDGDALLHWMTERENALAALGHGNVTRYASSPALIEGPLRSVRAAAEILDRDPRISTGERRLFDWLLVKEWIVRRGNEFAAARSALDNGLLAVVPRRLPHTGDSYPQIVITTAGLTELHALLGGSDITVLEQEPSR